MPDWIQVLLLWMVPAVIAGIGVMTARVCCQRGYAPQLSMAVVTVAVTLPSFLAICVVPNATVIVVPTFVGLALAALDFIVCVVAALYALFLLRRKEIDAFIGRS